ncbi:MAG: O-antigen ligase family protein [Clostridia bacterium]|nr:O-antigen ligase family protein [Clostridia bacterium]
MNLKSITENKYTLSDIFPKHHELWLMVPVVVYLLTPIVHMVSFAFLYKDQNDWTFEDYFHFFNTAESAGDYYSPIVHYAFLLGAFFLIPAILAYIAYAKKAAYRIVNIDSLPLYFFVLYSVLIIVSSIVNKTEPNYIFGFTSRAEGVLQVIGYMMIFYLCGSLIKKEKLKKFAVWFFLATGVVIAALTLINKYVTDITIIGDEYVSGIFYTHNFYAYYLSISIMLAAGLAALDESKGCRIIAFLIMCLNTFVLAINDSMGPFLAAIVSFVFLFVAVTYKNKKFSFAVLGLFAVFMGIVFVTGLFTPSFFSEFASLGKDVQKIVENDESAGEAGTLRWTLWTHTAHYIKEKPFIGWGIEGTAERLGTETHADKAHNEYLENMAYYGIPAGLCYLGGLIAVYIKALIKRKSVDKSTIICLAGALAYIGSAFVGNSFIFIAPFFFIFLGLANNTTGQYPPYPVKLIEEPDLAEESSESKESSPESEPEEAELKSEHIEYEESDESVAGEIESETVISESKTAN